MSRKKVHVSNPINEETLSKARNAFWGRIWQKV